MAYSYFYEELPLSKVVKVAKELEKRLWDEECRLALECHCGAAYITLNMKNGKTFHVARDKKWNGNGYTYRVQLLDEELDVAAETVYAMGAYGYENMSMELMDISAKVIRKGR